MRVTSVRTHWIKQTNRTFRLHLWLVVKDLQFHEIKFFGWSTLKHCGIYWTDIKLLSKSDRCSHLFLANEHPNDFGRWRHLDLTLSVSPTSVFISIALFAYWWHKLSARWATWFNQVGKSLTAFRASHILLQYITNNMHIPRSLFRLIPNILRVEALLSGYLRNSIIKQENYLFLQ